MGAYGSGGSRGLQMRLAGKWYKCAEAYLSLKRLILLAFSHRLNLAQTRQNWLKHGNTCPACDPSVTRIATVYKDGLVPVRETLDIFSLACPWIQ
jgi:hypothetical protein